MHRSEIVPADVASGPFSEVGGGSARPMEEALVAAALRGGLLRPPLAVCAARSGAGRQGRGQSFARRLINEDAAGRGSNTR